LSSGAFPAPACVEEKEILGGPSKFTNAPGSKTPPVLEVSAYGLRRLFDRE